MATKNDINTDLMLKISIKQFKTEMKSSELRIRIFTVITVYSAAIALGLFQKFF